MTVREFIEKLKQYPQDMPVGYSESFSGGFVAVMDSDIWVDSSQNTIPVTPPFIRIGEINT